MRQLQDVRRAVRDPFSDSSVNMTKSTLKNRPAFPDQSSLPEQMIDSALDSKDAFYSSDSILQRDQVTS